MMLDADACSRAVSSRDPRFDGVFFVGITTTRIYCRPVCPARVSYPERRRFFESAAAAERSGFRPCLRCRPELAPGRAVCDAVPRVARAAAIRIAAGALNGRSVGAGAGAGRERAPSPPRDGARARRVAGRAGADPSAAAGQVPADRHQAAGDPGGVRQRVSEPPAVQLGVPRALPHEPERASAAAALGPVAVAPERTVPVWSV